MRLAIFDMDGTLFDTERLTKEIMAKKMSERGYILRDDVYMEICGTNDHRFEEIMLREYGSDYPHKEIFGLVRDALTEKVRTNGVPVKTGIPELLEYLAENGKKCAVASSAKTVYVKEYLQISGLEKYFEVVIGGDMIEKSKPAPDIFLKACELTGTEPKDAIVFEDSENGIRAAANGNIPVICIFDMKRHEKNVTDMCFACVDDAHEAINVLKYI